MIKVGIIGSGFGLYGLLPAFNSISDCKVVAICGKHTSYLVNYCQSIGLTNTYTSWQEMLDKENLDAVAIAVIPSAQYYIAKTAINKGLHIFAEKPLAENVTKAKELLELANKKRVIHAVDFIFPEITEWRKVKDIIDKKDLGKLRQVNLNWDFLSYDIKNNISSWKTDIKEGGGALAYYFSHSLYYLEYLVGKIVNFKSLLSYSKESINGGETGVDLLIQFKNNVTGYAHLNCNNHGLKRHQLVFNFEKGTIILENKNSITADFNITIYTDGRTIQITIAGDKNSDKNEDERVKVVKKLANRFIDSVKNNKEFIPSFNEGVRVQKLIDQIRKQSKL